MQSAARSMQEETIRVANRDRTGKDKRCLFITYFSLSFIGKKSLGGTCAWLLTPNTQSGEERVVTPFYSPLMCQVSRSGRCRTGRLAKQSLSREACPFAAASRLPNCTIKPRDVHRPSHHPDQSRRRRQRLHGFSPREIRPPRRAFRWRRRP